MLDTEILRQRSSPMASAAEWVVFSATERSGVACTEDGSPEVLLFPGVSRGDLSAFRLARGLCCDGSVTHLSSAGTCRKK